MEIEVSTVINKTYVYTTKEERDEALESFEKQGYKIKSSGYQSYTLKRLQNIKGFEPGHVYPYIIIEIEED